VKNVVLRRVGHLSAGSIAFTALLAGRTAAAEPVPPLPAPLDPAVVVRVAHEHRAEIASARARAFAAAQEPHVVAALPDPMVAAEVQHFPIPVRGGVNGNLTVQQEFPLSGVLGDRRRAAEADAARWSAETRRVTQDVALDALAAYFMLGERRGLGPVLDEQIALVEQLATIARAHLASGQAMQADVLRLDNERARLQSDRAVLDAQIRGSEGMLDAALARPPDAPVPPLAWVDDTSEPPAIALLVQEAFARRPELASARAERSRALAEVDVMRSMYTPMAVVKIGPDYMSYFEMPSGAAALGVMAMVGVTVPLWRDKLSSGVIEAQSMATMTTADIDALERSIAGAIANARENVAAERTRLMSVQREILPRARLVVESAIAAFGAGQGPMVSALDSARDLYEVRMQEVMDRARLGTAWATLRRETGELE
jgi:outer membrane protein TolC